MEETPTYTVDQSMIVNLSLTLEIRHVGMVSDLIARGIGASFSAVIRAAIEHYYQSQNETEAA